MFANSWKYCENNYFDYTPNIAEIGCGTPPTPSLTDANQNSFTYITQPQQRNHHHQSRVEFVPKIENEYCNINNNNNNNNSSNINYIPTSMTSPTNTSFSSSPPTPDMLWEFGNEMDHHVNNSYAQQQQPTHHNYMPDIESNNCAKSAIMNSENSQLDVRPCSADIINYPNFEATKHQLIKEGLKVTIQSKRLALGLNQLSKEELSKTPSEEKPFNSLSREDEERRRRRRERNKVAATKCRNKKKYHVNKLSEESYSLEEANCSLQKEILSLKREQQKLLDVLNNHLPICRNRKHFVPYLSIAF